MNDGLALTLPGATHSPVFAAGAWMSNAVAALRGDQARLSPVLGNLATPEACIAHEAAAAAMLAWLGPAALIAHDLHPDFHSSRHAHALARQGGIATLAVQHHHAHIAAVCAEHGLTEPVLGLALDGVGLGTDGAAWGGELLRVDGASCQRLGYLMPLPLPGGDIAAREPWRLAVALLHNLGRTEEARRRFADEAALTGVLSLLQRDIRCPRSSSAGRLFDAAAGLLGLCRRMSEDAQAARALETAASRHIAQHGWPEAMPAAWQISAQATPLTLDLRALLARLSPIPDDVDHAAAVFHATLTAALVHWVAAAQRTTGIERVALGGGCFYNRLLASKLPEALRSRGLRVFQPERVPPGDAGLALGQAWVAALSLMR